MLRGPEAFALGIADAMFEPADFLEESLRWAAAVLTGAVTVARPDAGRDARRRDASRGVGRRRSPAARFFTDGKLHGAAPAPYRALDLVAARAHRVPRRGVRRRGRGPGRPAALG